MYKRGCWLLAVLSGLLVIALGLAQNEDIKLELGFEGNIVTNSWNPIRLTTRDQTTAELIITIVQGSLREQDVTATYQATIEGRTGINVFEDDLFVPPWRSFSWVLRTPERVLASGALDRRQSGIEPHKPLHLIVSGRPSQWLDVWGADARVVSVPSGVLPERLAAYDGVASLLIDGTAPAPKLGALAAATTAGVTTIALDPLPDSHRELLALAPSAEQRLGTGWLLRVPPTDLRANAQRTGLDMAALEDALITDDLRTVPKTVPQSTLLIATSLYAVTILLLLRFGGVGGLLTGLSLTLLASYGAWVWLRPDAEDVFLGRSLTISAGGLAQQAEVRTLFTLPGGDLELPISARPLEAVPYTTSPTGTRLSPARWASLTFRLKPQLKEASLQWQGDRLVNTGSVPLTDVYVKGLGPQTNLAVGIQLLPVDAEQRPLPDVYNRLLAFLPKGTALARNTGNLYAVLPNTSSLTSSDVVLTNSVSEARP